MPEKEKTESAKRLETLSVERRKFIGQAIIDGLLSPGEVVTLTSYLQTGGNYDQTGGGGHQQTGGGNYTQKPLV